MGNIGTDSCLKIRGASAGALEIKESAKLLSSLVGNSTRTWGAGGGGTIGAPLFVEHLQ